MFVGFGLSFTCLGRRDCGLCWVLVGLGCFDCDLMCWIDVSFVVNSVVIICSFMVVCVLFCFLPCVAFGWAFVFCAGLFLCLFEWNLIGFVGLLLGILMLGCGCLVCMLVWCGFWVADCGFVVFCYFLL